MRIVRPKLKVEHSWKYLYHLDFWFIRFKSCYFLNWDSEKNFSWMSHFNQNFFFEGQATDFIILPTRETERLLKVWIPETCLLPVGSRLQSRLLILNERCLMKTEKLQNWTEVKLPAFYSWSTNWCMKVFQLRKFLLYRRTRLKDRVAQTEIKLALSTR